MKVISFSLYGKNPKYSTGAVNNAMFINSFLPDWKARFYCSQDISPKILSDLSKFHAEVLMFDKNWHPNGMFWRFLPVLDLKVEMFLSRDTDSLISIREVSAIKEWVDSGQTLHIIRDHPYHQVLIPGGLWGLKCNDKSRDIDWDRTRDFGTKIQEDQKFLAKHVYPHLIQDSIIHDEFFCYEKNSKKISIPRVQSEYIGESQNEHGEVNQSLRKIIRKYEMNFWFRNKIKLTSLLRSKIFFLLV